MVKSENISAEIQRRKFSAEMLSDPAFDCRGHNISVFF